MNKSTKRRLLEQRRRKMVLARGSPALHGGAGNTVFAAELGFDHGSDISAKELEQYFDDTWRVRGGENSRDD